MGNDDQSAKCMVCPRGTPRSTCPYKRIFAGFGPGGTAAHCNVCKTIFPRLTFAQRQLLPGARGNTGGKGGGKGASHKPPPPAKAPKADASSSELLAVRAELAQLRQQMAAQVSSSTDVEEEDEPMGPDVAKLKAATAELHATVEYLQGLGEVEQTRAYGSVLLYEARLADVKAQRDKSASTFQNSKPLAERVLHAGRVHSTSMAQLEKGQTKLSVLQEALAVAQGLVDEQAQVVIDLHTRSEEKQLRHQELLLLQTPVTATVGPATPAASTLVPPPCTVAAVEQFNAMYTEVAATLASSPLTDLGAPGNTSATLAQLRNINELVQSMVLAEVKPPPPPLPSAALDDATLCTAVPALTAVAGTPDSASIARWTLDQSARNRWALEATKREITPDPKPLSKKHKTTDDI